MPEQQDEPQFPERGILWRGWGDETLREIAQRAQPVLLFVADPDSFEWPFLREIFKEMPANAQLRALMHESFIALNISADALPEFLKALGAGSRFHIAILSPYGLTPIATFAPVYGNPTKVVGEIALALESIARIY